jgi:hypothetical protein
MVNGLLNNANTTYGFTTTNTNGNYVQMEFMIRSTGSPVVFDLGCSNGGYSGTITVYAGSSMEVQKVT